MFGLVVAHLHAGVATTFNQSHQIPSIEPAQKLHRFLPLNPRLLQPLEREREGGRGEEREEEKERGRRRREGLTCQATKAREMIGSIIPIAVHDA